MLHPKKSSHHPVIIIFIIFLQIKNQPIQAYHCIPKSALCLHSIQHTMFILFT